MRKTSVLLVLMAFALQVAAQKFHLTIDFLKADSLQGLELYVGPMRANNSGMDVMIASGNKYMAEIETSPQGLYRLVAVKNGKQYSAPLYIAGGKESATISAKIEDNGRVNCSGDVNNDILSKFNRMIMGYDNELWEKKPGEKRLRAMLGDYEKLVRLVDPNGKAAPEVKEYLNVWAYIYTYNTITSLPRVYNVKADEVSLKAKDVLPAASEVLDNNMATLFRLSSYIASLELPRSSSLDELLGWIRSNYENEVMRARLESSVLTNYISRYDYSVDFDGGLANLRNVVEKYNLNERYVETFKKNRVAAKGTSFPENVVLKDVDGNVVNFSDFKGKYVYVDMWASWCAPCCKEVPHLQKLEAELQNKDVVFVSISIDSTEAPWKKKMAELNMHGHQLFESSKTFCEVMNISGIPFFLIYDKEGKLYRYNAPRPSSKEIKPLLESLK